MQPPPYSQGANNALANKRFKQEDGTAKPNVQPPCFLSPQQLQQLQYLQQNQANLNPQQQQVFQNLIHVSIFYEKYQFPLLIMVLLFPDLPNAA